MTAPATPISATLTPVRVVITTTPERAPLASKPSRAVASVAALPHALCVIRLTLSSQTTPANLFALTLTAKVATKAATRVTVIPPPAPGVTTTSKAFVFPASMTGGLLIALAAPAAGLVTLARAITLMIMGGVALVILILPVVRSVATCQRVKSATPASPSSQTAPANSIASTAFAVTAPRPIPVMSVTRATMLTAATFVLPAPPPLPVVLAVRMNTPAIFAPRVIILMIKIPVLFVHP